MTIFPSFRSLDLWRTFMHDSGLFNKMALSFHGITNHDMGIELDEPIREIRQNPYHHETIWEHTLMVYQLAKQNNCSELTEIGALLHDIGKPFVRRYDEEKDKAYFMGHEYASALLSVNFLKDNFPNDIQFMLNAICLHTFGFRGENLHEYFEDHDLIEYMKELNTLDNHGRLADEINGDDFSFVNPVDYERLEKNDKKFTILIGVPGCGKSTWCKENEKEAVFSTDENLIKIASEELGADENDYQACWKAITENDVNWVKRTQEQALDALRTHDDVIYDATNLQRKKRRHLGEMARHKGASIHYKLFWRDLNDCLNLGSRENNKFIPEGAYKSMCRNFSYPKIDEYDTLEHIII